MKSVSEFNEYVEKCKFKQEFLNLKEIQRL